MENTNEMDLLGFDPTQLSVFNRDEKPSNNGNPNIYHTRTADTVSEDGRYRCTIKVIYSPFDLKHSVLEQQSYNLRDANGWFDVVSSLTNDDKSCPIFNAWKKCRYAPDGSVLKKQETYEQQGGHKLFDKRFARYVTIQVLKDKNQPDLEGKYMLWKMPKAIWDIIDNKMHPSKESNKAAIPIMDFLFGRSIDIEVIPGPDDPKQPERKNRETKYIGELSEEPVSCLTPDCKSLLTSEEQMILDNYIASMTKVWRSKDSNERNDLIAQINADPNTMKLQSIYSNVLKQIKTFCPDLNKELGYHEWDDATKARVDAWIKIVLEGNDPAVETGISSDVLNNAGNNTSTASVQTNTPEPASQPALDPLSPEVLSANNDDLPF